MELKSNSQSAIRRYMKLFEEDLVKRILKFIKKHNNLYFGVDKKLLKASPNDTQLKQTVIERYYGLYLNILSTSCSVGFLGDEKVDFFGQNAKWKFLFEESLVNELKSSTQIFRLEIISLAHKLSYGFFDNVKFLKAGPSNLTGWFYITLQPKKILVFCTLLGFSKLKPELYVNAAPYQFKTVNRRLQIYFDKNVKFFQYIRFIGFVSTMTDINGFVNKFLAKNQSELMTTIECILHPEFLKYLIKDDELLAMIIAKDSMYSVVKEGQWHNKSICEPMFPETTITAEDKYPTGEKILKIKNPDFRNTKFKEDTKAIEEQSKKKRKSKKKNFDNIKEDEQEEILRELMTTKELEDIISFLGSIPHFNFKLTAEEKQLIEESGNILAIGRSGTGKTTCALLKLFATEVLFKYKKSLENKEDSKSKRFNSTGMDLISGLHSIFVTTSPVLTNEVRRHYEKLKEKVKEELANKEKKHEIEVIMTSEIEETVKGEPKKSLVQLFEEFKGTTDELELLEEGEATDQLALVHSLNDVEDKEFPLFLTVRRLLIMIDGTLTRPFFVRNSKGGIIGVNEKAEWHNESQGVMMINTMYKAVGEDLESNIETENPGALIDALEKQQEEFGDEIDDEDQTINTFNEEEQIILKNNLKKAKNVKKACMAKEVDYEVFSNKFWPTIKGKIFFKNRHAASILYLNPSFIWREIQTRIKGDMKAHEYNNHCIPYGSYSTEINNPTFYDCDIKKLIYKSFKKYKVWCDNNNYYDMSDIVNHMLSQIRWCGYNGPSIQFMLCDEVQDFSPATLYLLMKVTKQNMFFSGDTAQTISKSVNFRFADLHSLFMNKGMHSKIPCIMQLTTNFRSHGRILDLANSVIRALEILFPNSIDKLEKEKSLSDGMIPVVLDSNLQEVLFDLLTISEKGKEEQQLDKVTIEFGCDQVIIVRNQEAKKSLPSFLKHALCLTVYEAKGLEFDDVILYNFFTDSEAKDEWRLIASLIVETIRIPKGVLEKVEFKKTFEQLNVKTQELPESYKDLKEGEYDLIKNVSLIFTTYTKERYVSLISELKHLYTAITRPRKRLIIFDENTEIREPMLKYWLRLGYIKIITSQQLSKKNIRKNKLLGLISSRNVSKLGWRAQGIRMFSRCYYEQAMKCFEKSGDEKLKIRSEAYFNANQGEEALAKIDSIKYEVKETKPNRDRKKEIDIEISELTADAFKCFGQAAMIFDKLGMKIKAAQAYFNVQEYEKAAKYFEESNHLGLAGEAYFKLGKYNEAGELYEKANLPSNAIIAYEQLRDWERVLKCLFNFKDEFKYEYRMKLVKKYIQFELEDIYKEYESATNKPKEDKKELPLIEERLAEQLSSDEDDKTDNIVDNDKRDIDGHEKKNVDEQKIENVNEKCSHESMNQSNPFIEVDTKKGTDELPNYEMNPFVGVNTSIVSNPFEDLANDNSKHLNNSISDKGNSFSLVEALPEDPSKKVVLDMEHISNLNPEDEWLKCETGSIVDSIVSGNITISNRDSDYSLLDNAHAFVINSTLVNTKRDIYIEDITMSKIIKYVGYFSDEVRGYLETLRSKSVMLHNKKSNETTSADFIVDLDDIDIPFVNLLLDTIENFGLYKLCIIICNRYQINERLGRYIVSIGDRYSNIKTLSKECEKYVVSQINIEMQVTNSVIAHKAIHGVFEMIDPVYLKMKKYNEITNDRNSLGGYCYRSMMLLGYWKKLVYIMDCKNSLGLTSTFADYSNYKIIYLMNFGNINKQNAQEIQKIVKGCNFDWLPFTSPSNQLENHAFILALDSIVFELNKMFNFTYKNEVKSQIKECPKFPIQFPCNHALWKYLLSSENSNTLEIYSILSTKAKIFLSIDHSKPEDSLTKFMIWDFCIALIQILYGLDSNKRVEELFLSYPSNSYNELIQCIYKIINIVHIHKMNKAYNEYYYTAYLACLSAFGIRKVEGRDCKIGYGKLFSISRTSIYFDIVIKIVGKIRAMRREMIAENMMSMVEVNKKGKLVSSLKEKLQKKYDKLVDKEDIYFSDLDVDNMLINPELITEEIANKIANQVTKITLARLVIPKEKLCYRNVMINIWSLNSQEEIKNEIENTLSKIGEISFTMTILNLIKYPNDDYRDNKTFEYYEGLLSQKKYNEDFNKKGKPMSVIDEFDTELAFLFLKLQKLSLILFDSRNCNCTNSVNWILDIIKSSVCELLFSDTTYKKNQLFPILCCYLSIDKYIIFIEQVRALYKLHHMNMSYNYTIWLNALEEYKYNCYDDCFWHLVQFFEEVEDLDLFTQLIVVEKIIGFGIIMINSVNNKQVKISTNVLKHFNFTKISDKRYSLNTQYHESYSEIKENEMKKTCYVTIRKLLNNLFSHDSMEKAKLVLSYTYKLAVSLTMNLVYKKELIELEDLIKTIKRVKPIIAEGIIINESFYNWNESKKIQNITEENTIPRDMVYVEFIHNDSYKPNIEELRKAELKQYHQMAIHIKLYKALRSRKVKSVMRFDPMRYDIVDEVNDFGYNVSREIDYKRLQREAYDLVELVKDMHFIVLKTFYNTVTFNASDVHYLFTLLQTIDEYYINSVRIFGETVTKEDKKDGMTADEIKNAIEKMRIELKEWKDSKFTPDDEYIKKQKSIYRFKWQQHRQRQKQNVLGKISSAKVKALLTNKAMNLKGRLKTTIN